MQLNRNRNQGDRMGKTEDTDRKEISKPLTAKEVQAIESRMASRTSRIVELEEQKALVVKPANDELKHLRNENREDAHKLAARGGRIAHRNFDTNSTWLTDADGNK